MAVALLLGAAGLVLAFTRGGVGDRPADELRATYPTYDEVASWDFMAGEYGAGGTGARLHPGRRRGPSRRRAARNVPDV